MKGRDVGVPKQMQELNVGFNNDTDVNVKSSMRIISQAKASVCFKQSLSDQITVKIKVGCIPTVSVTF